MATATVARPSTRKPVKGKATRALKARPVRENPTMVDLVLMALSQPGIIKDAYSFFHAYSPGNQILAWYQCHQRDIKMGPIATYKKWAERGRQVRKGEKAIVLCMPSSFKTEKEDKKTGETKEVRVTYFKYAANWFVMSQTDPIKDDETVPFTLTGPDNGEYSEEIPGWDKATALKELDITEAEFDMANGNVQGYAQGRTIHISPIAAAPAETLFHEIGHIVLGHTDGNSHDAYGHRSTKEVEAGLVAMFCLESLGMEGSEAPRGYVQHWLAEDESIIDERLAKAVFKAVKTIIDAGQPKKEKKEDEEVES